MSKPGPICLKCKVEFVCTQNDKLVNDISTVCFSSTYWLGDLFRCPICHAEIVVGFGIDMNADQAGKFGHCVHSVTFARTVRQLTEYANQFERGGDEN